MQRNLESQLLRSIERGRERLIVPGDRIGIAVSGGADSVALLRLLNAARANWGIALIVLHLDHSLRAESGEDAGFVETLARSHGLEFVGERVDVAAAALHERRNLEEAARHLRYEFFARLAEQRRLSKVAVAHTMDDQAETVLARVLRGSGPAGLAGVRARSGLIVRPLLGIRRTALREYLLEIGQEWREDKTNADISRERARIRAKLIPLLESDFSPHAVERIARLADLAAEEERFWILLVEERFRALTTRRGESVSILASDLLAPARLLQRQGMADGAERSLTERFVRRLYKSIKGDLLQLGSLHVERIIGLAKAGTTGKRIELPAGVTVSLNFGELTFSRDKTACGVKRQNETRHSAHAYQYPVLLSPERPTDVSVPELGACFRLKVIDWSSTERDTTMWWSILDLDTLETPLFLRSWRAGDSYRPRGRRKLRKLKEMLLAARIRREERAGWPVLESRGQIVWARGMDAAEGFCARESTRAGVVIEERKL
jgi:tRNA(Ile)-lysidine synthase